MGVMALSYGRNVHSSTDNSPLQKRHAHSGVFQAAMCWSGAMTGVGIWGRRRCCRHKTMLVITNPSISMRTAIGVVALTTR